VTKRYWMPVLALVVVMGAGPLQAQQSPAAEKAAADAAEKARQEDRTAAERAREEDRATIRRETEAAATVRKAEIAAARELAERRSRIVPLDVEVVISRYQGDKKVSSLPFALTVNAPNQFSVNSVDAAPLTQLRMGGQVPVPTMAPALGPDGKPVTGFTGGGPVQYKDVGTYIDARGRWLDAGGYELSISVSEDAVATPQGSPATSLPVIRTFRASNNLILRDGQTRQFTAAADRITGEVVKVDVTLKVAK
jgi:hypothetical protein